MAEKYCTGDASPYEKFLAWARTVPQTLRNPLFHWTHLELKRYFGIDELLNEDSAKRIWDCANEQLQSSKRSVHGILTEFKVKAECTTDDPVDDLATHKAIAVSGIDTAVYPTFRPDKALQVHLPEAFAIWVKRLETSVGFEIKNYNALLEALSKRHAAFHEIGCRLSDHGLEHAYAESCTDSQADDIFKNALTGKAATQEEQAGFAANLMLHFGQWNAQKGWTMQLHLGAMRNNNTRLFKQIGPDTGFDSIGDQLQASSLSRFLNQLDLENALPKTILYNLNPADNYVIAAMLGNFQDGNIPGKNPMGQRMVVSGSERRHGMADECAFKSGIAIPFRGNADRFTFLYVLSTA